MAITDWNTNPALNATQPGINWAEGMQPKDINGSARQMMADIATLLKDAVDPRLPPFNAKCDGVTDDTNALQAAYDYCSGVGVNRVLRIPGKCYVTRSITVNRRVDTATGEMLTIGDGPQAGFYTDQAIKIFDTTIANGVDPQSEAMKFQNVRFECSNSALSTFAFSQDFLRMKFISCYFLKMKVVNSAIYVQGWGFVQCNFRHWTGTTFAAGDGQKSMFACHWDQCTWEFGEQGIRGLATGCSIISCVFEGSTQFYWQAGSSGLLVMGNYTEGNTLADYTFSDIPNGGTGSAIAFIGNFMQVGTTVYNVILGDVRGFFSAGNNCNGNLFDMNKTRFGRIISVGDHTSGHKFSPAAAGEGPHSTREVYAVGTGNFASVTAHAGGGRAGAPTISTHLTIVPICATANDSLLLPASDDMIDPDFGTDGGDEPTRSIYREWILQNNGVANLALMTAQNDLVNYGLNVTLVIAPGTTRRVAQIGAGLAPIFLN